MGESLKCKVRIILIAAFLVLVVEIKTMMIMCCRSWKKAENLDCYRSCEVEICLDTGESVSCSLDCRNSIQAGCSL